MQRLSGSIARGVQDDIAMRVGEPEIEALLSASPSASTKLSRFGKPVSESWRTR